MFEDIYIYIYININVSRRTVNAPQMIEIK